MAYTFWSLAGYSERLCLMLCPQNKMLWVAFRPDGIEVRLAFHPDGTVGVYWSSFETEWKPIRLITHYFPPWSLMWGQLLRFRMLWSLVEVAVRLSFYLLWLAFCDSYAGLAFCPGGVEASSTASAPAISSKYSARFVFVILVLALKYCYIFSFILRSICKSCQSFVSGFAHAHHRQQWCRCYAVTQVTQSHCHSPWKDCSGSLWCTWCTAAPTGFFYNTCLPLQCALWWRTWNWHAGFGFHLVWIPFRLVWIPSGRNAKPAWLSQNASHKRRKRALLGLQAGTVTSWSSGVIPTAKTSAALGVWSAVSDRFCSVCTDLYNTCHSVWAAL